MFARRQTEEEDLISAHVSVAADHSLVCNYAPLFDIELHLVCVLLLSVYTLTNFSTFVFLPALPRADPTAPPRSPPSLLSTVLSAPT